MPIKADTVDLVNVSREKQKTKYLDGEITEEEYVSAMSQLTTEQEVAENVEQMKAEKYRELQEKFENDEITDEELESEMDRLFDSGDEFLEIEPDPTPDTTDRVSGVVSFLRSKLDYYAFPIIVLLPLLVALLVPGINPMLSIVAAGPLLAFGLFLYGMYWARSNL